MSQPSLFTALQSNAEGRWAVQIQIQIPSSPLRLAVSPAALAEVREAQVTEGVVDQHQRWQHRQPQPMAPEVAPLQQRLDVTSRPRLAAREPEVAGRAAAAPPPSPRCRCCLCQGGCHRHSP